MQIPDYQERIREPVGSPQFQQFPVNRTGEAIVQGLSNIGQTVSKIAQVENEKIATNEYNNAFRDWKESYLAWEREELDNAYTIDPDTGKPRYHNFEKDFEQFHTKFWQRKEKELTSPQAKQAFRERMQDDIIGYNDRLARSSDALVEKKAYNDLLKNTGWAASNGNVALVNQYLDSYQAAGVDADYDTLRDEFEYKAYYANTRTSLLEIASEDGYEAAIDAVRQTQNFPDLELADREKLAKDIEGEYLRVQRKIEAREREEGEKEYVQLLQNFYEGDLTQHDVLYTNKYGYHFKYTPRDRERFANMLAQLEEAEANPGPEGPSGPGGPSDEEKNNYEADILSLIYSQAKTNEEIEQMIIDGQRKEFLTGGTARTLLGKNMTENPNQYMKEAATIMRNAFDEEPAELAKAMDYLTTQARILTYDNKGKVGGQFNQEEIITLAKNYIEPSSMKKIGEVMKDSPKLFGLIDGGLNREEKAAQALWNQEYLGTVETGPVVRAISNGFTEDFIEQTILAGQDRGDLTKLEQQHLDNNIRIAQLGQAHKQFFQDTFGEEPEDVGVLQNGAATFQDRYGKWWTVKVPKDGKDEEWYVWQYNSWIMSENPMIDRGQAAQDYTKSQRGAMP